MTYITLYRKYRPKIFTEIVGQKHITKTLSNALKASKTSHAYLFSGPRGTGKTSTAKILAKSLNCQVRHQKTKTDENKKTVNRPSEPCNNCQNCKDIDSSSSVDVLEIDAASNRGIDEIRSLRERVHFAPVQGSKKIFIIDEVHMLTTEAFNALLKMIEEPPEHAVFILATTEIHKVIPTIISRCQRFDFRRILVADTVKCLKNIAKKEGIKVDESTLAVIARQGQGSVRDSIGLLDQLASFSDKKITAEVLAQTLNLTESELLFEITNFILKKDTLSCLRFINRLMDKGFDIRQFSAELIQHFRSIAIALATDKPADIIHTTPESLSRIQDQASQFKIFEALKAIDILSDTYHQMRFSSDSRLLFEIALIKLTRLDADISIKGLLYRIEELEEKLGTAKTLHKTTMKETKSLANNTKKQNNSAPKKEREISKKEEDTSLEEMSNIQRIWPIVMQKIKSENIPLFSLMLESHPVQNKNSKLTLMFNKKANFHLKEVTKKPNLSLIRKTLRDVTGKEVDVECTVDNEIPEDKETKTSKDMSAEHVIKLMQDSFSAEIVEKTTITKEDN